MVVVVRGQYVAEDKGGLMRYIPQYDKAGNKMGDEWWHPIYKLDQTPPPWQPWQKTQTTEFTDQQFNPETLKIENFHHDALQTWPTPIVTGKPGQVQHPGAKYDVQGPSAGELLKPYQDKVGHTPFGQTPYPNYNMRVAAMPMHEDYLRINPKLAQQSLDGKAQRTPQISQRDLILGTFLSVIGNMQQKRANADLATSKANADTSIQVGNPMAEPTGGKKMPLPLDFLETRFYPRAPVHLASTIIARGQPVPTADLNGATHTVVHQALQGVNVGAAQNPYAATQPSAVAFATNPLAYHPQAIVHHPSQIGAAAVAQTRTLQHAYGAYEGGNVVYHPTHAPIIGYQRAHTHYIRTAYAPRPGDANYGYHPYASPAGHLGHIYANPIHPVHPIHYPIAHLPTGYGVHGPHAYLPHPGVVLPRAHPSGLVYPQQLIEISSRFRKQVPRVSAYKGKKPSAYRAVASKKMVRKEVKNV
eukprot:g6552.t1